MQPELHIDPSINNKHFPRFDKPRIIGFIGLENLKFARNLQEQKVCFDLNLHIDKAKTKPPDLDVKLTDLLQFLLENERRLNFHPENDLKSAKFFCYRGLMTCVACTPYENQEPWRIVAVLYRGNIFLCARDTQEKLEKKLNMTESEKRFTSWGYKFEQYILSDTPADEPNPDRPVNETEEFSLVFTTHLNQHTIVYGAEMDGILCDNDKYPVMAPSAEGGLQAAVHYLSFKEFIELKTSRHLEFPRQENNFRKFKTKKWWCQSFLVGINKILCGFRNDDGIVEELKVFQVRELPKMSKRFWNPNLMFNFLETFFTYVKRCLARQIKEQCGQEKLKNLQSLPLIALHFEWKPGMPVQVTDNYVYEDDPILPQWFLDNYGKVRTEGSEKECCQQN